MSRGSIKHVVMASVLVLVAATPMVAQSLADAITQATTLEVVPLVRDYESVVLTIGGEGVYIRREFSASEAVSIDLAQEMGAELRDGTFTWEMVFVPRQRIRKGAGAEVSFETLESRVESGTFTIEDGVMVKANVPEGGFAKDIVHNDDVIITFSLCVGNDCVNGENFGFDTLRLKENNLRIHFLDTSNSASFPSNDWRIVANDSSNGGDNYLAFEDSTAGRQIFRVDAGGPANSLRVDSAGDVGLGTSNPVVELHVVDGDTPTLRLEQNGSSGFTPQTWDVAGNETNFFVRDATNGSALSFRIKPGSGTDDAIVIDSDGDVGFGTDSPDEALHVERTAAGDRTLLKLENNGRVRLDLVGAGGETWFFQNDTGNVQDRFAISLQGSGGTELQVHERLDGSGLATLVVDGSVQATNVTFSSSRALKTEIAPVSGETILEAVGSLPLSTWRLKTDDASVRHLGPMAEDFSVAFGLGGSSERISVTDVNGVALAAIQGLLRKVEKLEARIRELESGSE